MEEMSLYSKTDAMPRVYFKRHHCYQELMKNKQFYHGFIPMAPAITIGKNLASLLANHETDPEVEADITEELDLKELELGCIDELDVIELEDLIELELGCIEELEINELELETDELDPSFKTSFPQKYSSL